MSERLAKDSPLRHKLTTWQTIGSVAVVGLVFLCGAMPSCGNGSTTVRAPAPNLRGNVASSVPRIWIVSVGVSTYQEAAISLHYAAKDATDIDRFFASATGDAAVPAQRRVLLVDKKATRASVIRGLREMAQQTRPEDVLLVFMAMHGVPDVDGQVYFATYDTTKDNLAGTALSQGDVERILQMAAAKRVVLFADACHAGAVGLVREGRRSFENANTNRLIAALAKSRAGIAVFSASRAAEESQEGSRWGGGHGVFTHYVLGGMRGAADANRDTIVTISELEQYVRDRVVRDTSGDQHPDLQGTFDNSMPIAIAAGPVLASQQRADVPDDCSGESVAECQVSCDEGSTQSCAILGSIYLFGTGSKEDLERGVALSKKACDSGSAFGCYEFAYALLSGRGVPMDIQQGSIVEQKACDGGYALGCYNLASLYQQGNGVAHDDVRATVLLKRACDGGLADACNDLGSMYQYGVGVKMDATVSSGLYKKACDLGFMFACSQLGDLYGSGVGVSKDRKKAVDLYRHACDLSDSKGCVQLGVACETGWGGETKSPSRAFALYAQECQKGAGLGCVYEGGLFESGRGVARNAARAAELYDYACRVGVPDGCGRLGELYEDGKSLGRDDTRAVSLYMQSCDRGGMEGCASLGWMYLKGRGVGADPARATSLYRQACDKGSGYGCTQLGKAFTAGTGVKKDQSRAADLYTKAAGIFKQGCDGDDPSSCDELGSAYSLGRGLVKSDSRAASLYRLACNADNLTGCVHLAEAYFDGRGVEKDLLQATTFFKLGCNGVDDCDAFAFLYESGGPDVPMNLEKAVSLYRHACEEDEVWACDQLKRLGHSP